MIERYLKNLHPAINKDPQAENSLYITSTGYHTLVIKDGVLVVSDVGSYDLASNTLSSLASILDALPTINCSVVQFPQLSALTLIEGKFETPVMLQSFTSVLWQISMTLAKQFEAIDKNTTQAQFQITPDTASGAWLRNIGEFYGVINQPNEPDILYSTRITDFSIGHRVNNIAIQKVLANLGYASTVVDDGPKSFSVNVHLPQVPPSGYVYSLTVLSDMVHKLKTAGITVTIILHGAMSDTLKVRDAVAHWVNPIGKWGTFKWGRTNWS